MFKKHPQDRELLKQLLALGQELRAKGKAAQNSNNVSKAQSYYLAAEAVAHYAAKMPHMLEARGKKPHAKK